MIKPRLFLCSGATIRTPPNDHQVVRLDSLDEDGNVHIRIEDVAKVFLQHLSPRLTDLLEIAAYVYSADCGTNRGKQWEDDAIEPWSRTFQFVIAVRDHAFWKQREICELLQTTLNFMSDDKYSFTFQKLKTTRPKEPYLNFGPDERWPFTNPERVVMFSGGLDSLAGAIETVKAGKEAVLVSHRPSPTMDRRQRKLFELLKTQFHKNLIHIPVWVNKSGMSREHTQRTRSFLYAAIGSVVAASVNAGGVRFFENGVISLNLPLADEVLRSRASRTTHPQALSYLQKILSLVMNRAFQVDNPFIFKTKTEVVGLIKSNGLERLISDTCSCSHTGFFQSGSQWHCGGCSQCIDRRVATIAADVAEFDPDTDYISNVFTGARKNGYEKNIAVDWVRSAVQMREMNDVQIATKFNLEFSRAARVFERPGESADLLLSMLKRNSETAIEVLKTELEKSSLTLLTTGMDKSSLLGMAVGGEHLKPSWTRLCQRIVNTLRAGLPTICAKVMPETEPDLQEICDGLLKTQCLDLQREFPFLKWSASRTKPDWSQEALCLWIELKYVRKKRDIIEITEAIAADITKYGDNGRRILYIVYDPKHLIDDEAGFGKEIHQRESMLVEFIR